MTTADLWLLLAVAVAALLIGSAVVMAVEFHRAPLIDEPIVHACPPVGAGLMPCCGRTPLEVPREDRITGFGPLVTCDGAR